MGKIENIHHPKDEGQARWDKKEEPSIDQPVKDENGCDIHFFFSLFNPLMTSVISNQAHFWQRPKVITNPSGSALKHSWVVVEEFDLVPFYREVLSQSHGP